MNERSPWSIAPDVLAPPIGPVGRVKTSAMVVKSSFEAAQTAALAQDMTPIARPFKASKTTG
jgi:hypothetical protein